jgi:hypothetical protein
MCLNCMSNAEAAMVAAAGVGYVVKAPLHRALAAVGLAPAPDPVAHDVRTVAFLRGLDLDPVAVLGADVVAAAEAWVPAAQDPVRARRARWAASARPMGSHRLITAT